MMWLIFPAMAIALIAIQYAVVAMFRGPDIRDPFAAGRHSGLI